MTPDTVDALLAGVAIGFAVCLVLWAFCGRRQPPHDQIRRRIFTLARQAAAELTDPSDSEITEMMADARLAPNRQTLYALYVLALGQALLKARQKIPPDRPEPSEPPAN